MVGNFREVYLFSCFSQVKSHLWKLKPQKFCFPRVKRMNHVSIPGLLLYSSLQKHVSECALDGYHWHNPKCYVNTDARSRQWRKAESESNHHGSQIHWSGKLKPRKFLKLEFWPISQKFVPTKITNHTHTHTHTYTPSSQRTVWHSHTSWQAISNARHVTPTPHHFAKASTVSRSKWFVGLSNIRNLGLNKMPVDTLQLVLALGHHWSQRSLIGDDTLPLFALEFCTGSVLVMLCPSQVDRHDAVWSGWVGPGDEATAR